MEFVTAKKGTPHFTSEHFRSILTAICGTGTYVADLYDKLEPELAANNVIKIHSGCLLHHGGVFWVKSDTYDEVTYQNGTQGMQRIDLVVGRYTKDAETGIENGEWVVIQGTPAESDPVAPDYTAGDMQEGDLIDDCPLFEIYFDGINVVEIKKLVEETTNIDEMKKEIAQLNNNMKWKSLETIDSRTVRIPEKFNEICVRGYTSNYNNVSLTLTPNDIKENTYFRFGHYNTSSDNCGFTICVSNNTIYLHDAYASGVQYSDTAKIEGSYR